MSEHLLVPESGKNSETLKSDAPSSVSGGQLAGREVKRAAHDSRESIIAFDSNGDCVWANPTARRFLGLADGVPESGRLNLAHHSLLSGISEPAGPLSVGYGLRPEVPCNGSEATPPDSTSPHPRTENSGSIGGADAFKQPWEEASKGPPSPGDAGPDVLLDHSIETAKRMVRRVTHDFNNLIAVVRGYAEVLHCRPELDDDSKQMVALIDRAASEIAGLSERMSSYADATHSNEGPSNLNLVIKKLLDQSGDLIPANIELEVEFCDPLPDVAGGEERLRQACWNVWNNAIEAMPQGGRLTCQTSTQWTRYQPSGQQNGAEPSRFVRVRVTDSGEGMDAEARAAMFAPFYTTKSGKCRGIGATAVYETVRDCGGFIKVSSEPGSGTSIDLYFSALEVATLPPPAQEGPASRETSGRLLVVDDDSMVRMATQRMLAHLGYESIAASGGEEALAIYKQSAAAISAVLLDVTMPGLSGIETLRLLREIDSRVKVIMYTGDPLAPGLSDMEPQAVVAVLPKPFRIEQLVQAMEGALAA